MKIFKLPKKNLVFFSFVALSLLLSSLAAAADTVLIASPPDGIWVSESKIFISGTSNSSSEAVKITGAGKVEVKPGGVFGAVVSLDRGANTIKVEANGDKKEIHVFYAADQKKYRPPAEFSRYYSHSDPVARDCKECHRFKDNKFDFKRLIPARADCTTKCHKEIGKSEHVHGPVGAGVCISCHTPHGSKNRGFVVKEGSALCTSCHQDRHEEFEREVLHPALEDGCTGCHNPHESSQRYQLEYEGDSISALCFNCHDQDMFMQETKHSPVEEGDCVACHQPHSSDNSSLLIAPVEGGALCFECHDYMQEDMQKEYIHAPAEESCTECHDPHSSNASYMLKKPGGDLCAMCHREYTPEIYEAIDNAKTEHPPVAEGRCIECHRPHSSDNPSLLADSMEKLCFKCHDDLGAVVAESTNRHGPVKTGDCIACHNVHGSPYERLLVRYFPVTFYSSYSKNKYDLCFGCHNPDIARTKRTENLTEFRDGSYNLHFFHVNNEKGRTCIACHDPHASNQAKHLRYEVPFGAWSYPINYTKTPAGGSCVVGCHAPKQYDRKNPKIQR